MIIHRKHKRKRKSINKKAKTFIALWADNNGNGTFGILNNPCNSIEAAILQIIKDIRINNYENLNLDHCKLELIQHWELSMPGIINYKIESI